MISEQIGIFGHLEIDVIDKESGKVETILDEKNKIVDTGFRSFLGVIADTDQYQYGFNGIYLGDDVGNGTTQEPEPASASTTTADQNLVYRVPELDTFTQTPDYNKLRFVTIIDGYDMMAVTGQPRNVLTSVSLRNRRNEIVAYKRFRAISTSPLISISIRWTITVLDQCKDIPTRWVKDILFYVIEDIEQYIDSQDTNYPTEIQYGLGQFTREVNLSHSQDDIHIIALQEWSDGTLTAIDWNDSAPMSPNSTVEIGEGLTATKSTYKSYIQTLRLDDDVPESDITVCANGVCEILKVTKDWRYPQVVDNVVPVGYLPSDMWENNKYWKFKNTTGALFGPNTIRTIYGASPHIWNYWVEFDYVVLKNLNTGQIYKRSTGAIIQHVSVTFDNDMRPVIVWVSGDVMWMNYYDKDHGDYTTKSLGIGTSPYLFNHGMNFAVFSVTSPTVIYVDPTHGQLLTRTLADKWESTQIVEDNVTDILTCGLTALNSVRVVYTKNVNGVPEIRNIGTDRLGAVEGEQSDETTITAGITGIGFF